MTQSFGKKPQPFLSLNSELLVCISQGSEAKNSYLILRVRRNTIDGLRIARHDLKEMFLKCVDTLKLMSKILYVRSYFWTDTFLFIPVTLPGGFCLSYGSALSGVPFFREAGYISEWIYRRHKSLKVKCFWFARAMCSRHLLLLLLLCLVLRKGLAGVTKSHSLEDETTEFQNQP